MESDVLVVDDSAAIRKILQRVLRQTGMAIRDIYEAGDGQEALQVLNSQKINLVLTDINMPKMDGIQLLAAIRRSTQTQHPNHTTSVIQCRHPTVKISLQSEASLKKLSSLLKVPPASWVTYTSGEPPQGSNWALLVVSCNEMGGDTWYADVFLHVFGVGRRDLRILTIERIPVANRCLLRAREGAADQEDVSTRRDPDGDRRHRVGSVLGVVRRGVVSDPRHTGRERVAAELEHDGFEVGRCGELSHPGKPAKIRGNSGVRNQRR